MSFFSICVPLYNLAPYLGDCLESISGQPYPDWECLCVDDGSRDATGELLDAHARKEARIRVVHQRNAGVSFARNRALNDACGDWVWFVDGDDMLRPGALRMLYDALVLSDVDGVDAVAFGFEMGEVPPKVWPEAGVRFVSAERTLETWWHFRLSVFRTLFRRATIGDLRFKRYGMGEDCLFSAMFFFRSSRWMTWKTSFYFYRERQGSAVHVRPSVRSVTDWFLVQREFLALLGTDGRLDKIGGGQGFISSSLGDGFLLHQRHDVFPYGLARYACLFRSLVGQSSSHRGLVSLPSLQAGCSGGFETLPFASFGKDSGGLSSLGTPCTTSALSVRADFSFVRQSFASHLQQEGVA